MSAASPDDVTRVDGADNSAPLTLAPTERGARPVALTSPWRVALWRWLVRPQAVEVVGLCALLGIAAAARWPGLWLIPTFTDETLEVRLAIQILRGEALPLTNVDPYIGAFWNYLLADGFLLVGLNPWLPRLLVFLAGVGTIGAAWWLGREIGGRLGAVVSALFLAGCSTHALVNSHVSWSHATTPLWTTLGLACLARALRVQALTPQPPFPQVSEGETIAPPSPAERERGAGGERAGGLWLVGAGFFLGLGVQTHITAGLLLPGAALVVLVQRPGLMRSRWAVFAALAFLLATANLVFYNVATGGGSLRGGQAVLADYTGQDDPIGGGNYVENVTRLTLATSWILSGAIDKRRFVGETLADPPLLGYLGLAIGSVAYAAWRGRWLPLLVTLPYLAILPLLQPKYEPILNGRYVVPVLPLVFASIGLVVSDGWQALRHWQPTRAPMIGGLLVAATVLIGLYPLVPMVLYERSARTNDPVFAAYQTIEAAREPSETVLLDYGLDGVFFMAAGSAYKSMELLLGASDVPFDVIDARQSSIEDALAGHSSRLIVLNSDKVSPLGRSFTLSPLMGGGRGGPGFGVYRVSARR